MRFRLRDIQLRDALIVGVPVVALIVAGFWYAAQFIKPAPPDRLVIASGGDGGAYQRFAAAYRPLIERYGIKFVEVPTAGAVENLALLRDATKELDVAFMQGGTRRRRGRPDRARVARQHLLRAAVGVLRRQRDRSTTSRSSRASGSRSARRAAVRASSGSTCSRRAARRARRRSCCRSAASRRSRR